MLPVDSNAPADRGALMARFREVRRTTGPRFGVLATWREKAPWNLGDENVSGARIRTLTDDLRQAAAALDAAGRRPQGKQGSGGGGDDVVDADFREVA